jgi:hypothetical protein
MAVDYERLLRDSNFSTVLQRNRIFRVQYSISEH